MTKPDASTVEIESATLLAWPDSEAGRLADVDTWARQVGVGRAELAAQVARHVHAQPDEWLEGRRLEYARSRLREGASTDQAGQEAGWAEVCEWEDTFRRRFLIAPDAYRDLRGASRFAFEVPSWLARQPLLAYLGRDPKSASEQVSGRRFRFSATVAGTTLGVTVTLGDHMGEAEIMAAAGPSNGLPHDRAWAIHEILRRLLGAHLDPRPFERGVVGKPDLRALVDPQRGLAISQTRDLFDALLWVVAGQQVSLPVAFALRRRLTRHVGVRIDDRLFAPPTPVAVADMSIAELRGLGFSMRKAEYLLGMARAAAEGTLDLRTANRSAIEVTATLSALRGLGPWSVGYLLMRAFGFADCVPVGDAALVRKLEGFFRLDQRPDRAATVALMANFAPYRSLATFYLWALPEYR